VESDAAGARAAAASAPQAAPRGNRSGVWLSTYDYFSSGRDAAFTGRHHIVLLQHGNRLTGRSLPRGSRT
jgi:hypothetical protein